MLTDVFSALYSSSVRMLYMCVFVPGKHHLNTKQRGNRTHNTLPKHAAITYATERRIR